MWKWIQYLCIHICISLTNTVDLLLPFTICCNFFRSSSHWIISFVIYIRLGPYHVGTLKLPTYICACTMYHVHAYTQTLSSLYLSLTHSFTHTESFLISFVFTRFNFVLDTFFFTICVHTNNSWAKIKFSFKIPSFYLSPSFVFYLLCFFTFIFRSLFCFESPMSFLSFGRRHQIFYTVLMIKYHSSWCAAI